MFGTFTTLPPLYTSSIPGEVIYNLTKKVFEFGTQEQGMSTNSDEIIGIGETLITRHPDQFTQDFEANKQRVVQLTDVESTRVQNRVAGYITRQIKADKEGEPP